MYVAGSAGVIYQTVQAAQLLSRISFRAASWRRRAPERKPPQKIDAAVEGPGFKPAVSRLIDDAFDTAPFRLCALPVPPERPARFCARDRRFESASLHRRVRCKSGFACYLYAAKRSFLLTDFRDAEAINEAVQRPTMAFLL